MFGSLAKVILHIDLNSFFATCEQQDNPELRGAPLGVVQDSGKRGVIIGSSREAKMIEIGTGMLVGEARKIYKNINIVPAHFERYVDYSRLFRRVCQYYSDQIEVFSVDELFVEVEKAKAVAIVWEIKRRLRVEVGGWFSVSVGVAPNKMLAKLASGSKKPDGLVVVDPLKRLEFLDKFELWHICGIAQRIQRRLNRLGIFTIKQMRQVGAEVLKKEFGVMGEVYWQWAEGRDPSPIVSTEVRPPEKSFGNQVTLPADVMTEKEVMRVFLNLSWQVASRMREKGMGGKTVSLSIRGGGSGFHRQLTTGRDCATAYDIYDTAKLIYTKINWAKPVRFVGISISKLIPLETAPLPLLGDGVKKERLSRAIDGISLKWGRFMVRPGKLLGGGIKDSELNGFSKRF